MTFTFTEKDLRTALEANGWTIGWGGEDFRGGDWVPPGGDADHQSRSFRKAVESLFYNKNLVPADMKEFWR